jgi:hypothetical protein
MADNLNEERNLREQINNLIQQYIELLRQAGLSQDGLNAREQEYRDRLDAAGDSQQRLNELQEDLTNEVTNTGQAVKSLNAEFDIVSEQLNDIVGELGNAGDLGRRILGTFRNLRDVTDKIRDDRDLTRVLSIKQLETEKENLGLQQTRLDREIERGLKVAASEANINRLRREGNVDVAETLEALARGETISENRLDLLRQNQDALSGLSDKEKERVLEAISFNRITGKSAANYEALNNQIEKAVQREKELNKNMGLTGSIVEGLGKLPGLNRVFRTEDIEEVKKAAREALVEQKSLMDEIKALNLENIDVEANIVKLRKEAQTALEEGNEELAERKLKESQILQTKLNSNKAQIESNKLQASQLELINQSSIASKLFQKSLSNLKETITDPAFLFTAVTDALVRNSKLTNQFQTELGVSYSNALAMRKEIANAADASGELFINSENLQKSVFALAEQTGVFFSLSSRSAETFTVLTERMGLAANEAGNLTMLLRLQGKDTEATMSNLVGTANAALATSKTTANVKDIVGDIAKTSKGLQASFAANPGALAKAAVAARELGATLKDIEGTQKSLLEFESSIGAELEAELLTGKQLNLERARAAALNNDLKTVSEELLKQGVDLASFSEMNVLQQEKMAAAMGMSRDAMGEMLLRQQTQGMEAEEVRKKFGEQAYEQFKAMDASEKMSAAVAKLKDIFANIMVAFTPIIDGFAMLLEPIAFIGKLLAKLNEWTGGWSSKLIGAAVIVKTLGGSFGGLKNIIFNTFSTDSFTNFFGGLKDQIKGVSLGGLKDRIKGVFSSDAYTSFFEGLKDKFGEFSDSFGGVKDKIKETFMGGADKAAGIQFDERIGKKGGFRDMASGRFVSEEAANAAGVFKPGTSPADVAAAAAPKGVTPEIAGATDAAGATGATPAPKDNGKALKEKMQNIAEGIKSFADKDVLKGALNMVIAAPGLIALGLASIPLKITEKINGKAIETGMTSIANGIKAFEGTTKGALALLVATPGLLALGLAAPGLALIGVVGTGIAAGLKGIATGMNALGKNMVGVIKGSIALTTLALPIAAAAAAFKLLEGINPGAIIAFSVSLGILGAAAAILGNIFPQVALGALALTTLALPIAATAAAFSLLEGIDTSMMLGFAAALGVLGLAAAGFGLVAPLIIAGSVAIGALGLALLPLAVAMNVAAPAAEQFAQVLSSLGEVNVTSLFGLAAALPALALGIGTLALSIGAAVLAAVSLKIITSALEPLAEIAPKLSLTDETLKNIANSASTLAEALNGINISPLILLSQIGEKVSNLKDTFASIGEGIASMGSAIKDKLLNIGEGFKNFFGGLKDKFAVVGEVVKGKFTEIKEKITPTVKADYTPRPEQAGVSGDMSGVISENVRTAVVDVLRETLPNGEIKVTAVVENLETGDRAEGITMLPANSPERIQETAEQSAALKAKGNLTSGILSSTKETRAAGIDPNSPTGRQQGATVEEIEGIVSTTIKALVPEMVAALKEGQGKIQVTNDNFNNSRQSEGPSRNRNIVNNNFA